MCCCDSPNINGQMGYKWQPNDRPSIRPTYPPAIDKDETLIFDEPGRCGGTDCHSHHYRVTKWHGAVFVSVQHGGGKESIRLTGGVQFLAWLDAMDSTQRYWMLHTLYYAYHDGHTRGVNETRISWQSAAIEKRIKTRKQRGASNVRVWIEPKLCYVNS